jgi:hypothetical protein
VNALVRCTAISLKGFSASAEVSFLLLRRSSANAKLELSKVNVSKITDEKDAVRI